MEQDNLIAKELVKEGAAEITIRHGDALPVANPNNVRIHGNIDAPSRFAAVRDMDQKTSYCYYSTTTGKIHLVVGEQLEYGRHEVSGSMQLTQKFESLHINGDKTYGPRQLATKFKLLRTLFPSFEDHMKICKDLNNLELKVDKTVKDLDDNRGNTSAIRTQALESNIPESFRITLPIIQGEPAQTIEVQILLFYAGGSIQCSLESPDAADYIETIYERRVMEEVKKLEGKTTLIPR